MYKKQFFLVWLIFWFAGSPELNQLPTVLAFKTQRRATTVSTPAQQNLKVFDTVWKLVHEKYYDPKLTSLTWNKTRDEFRPQAAEADTESQLYRIINKMLANLEDRHTFAQSPTVVAEEKRRSRVGIGFSIRPVEDHLVVTHIIGGSAAQEAGIKPGWIILERDGEPVDISRPYLVQEGQTVNLKFLDSQDQLKKIQVRCRPYALTPEQKIQTLNKGIIYLRWAEFAQNTGDWFAERVAQNRQAPGMIIDLRGNGGGLLETLVDCLGCLYPKESVFGEFVQRSGRQLRLRVPGRGSRAYTGEVVVLIDNESASAAEIFASALQESGRGKVIGRRSSGAVLASIEEDLPDGGKLQLSIRDYLTSRGHRLEGYGVEPDVPVTLNLADVRRNLDRDLERAIALLSH